MVAPGIRRRHARDAAPRGCEILRLQRVLLLFARIVLPLHGIHAWPLNGLLGTVHDQRLSLFTAELWLALHPEQRVGQALDPLDRTADRAFVDIVEKTEELLGHVAAVVDQHDQQVVLQAADVERMAGFGFAALRGVPWS